MEKRDSVLASPRRCGGVTASISSSISSEKLAFAFSVSGSAKKSDTIRAPP